MENYEKSQVGMVEPAPKSLIPTYVGIILVVLLLVTGVAYLYSKYKA